MYFSPLRCKKKNQIKSCYDLSVLRKIAKRYNEANTDKIDLHLSKNDLIGVLTKKMKHCKDEVCWMNSYFLDIESPFKSVVSEKGLSNHDIDNLMMSIKGLNYQYIDNFEPNIRGKTGMVYHTNNKHWVGIYADKDIVVYFDPLGKLPNSQLNNLLKKLSKTRSLVTNTKRVQPKSEKTCGVYVVLFFYQMLGIHKNIEDIIVL